MLLKNSYYTLEITSHIWLKKTDDLFDFDSENKSTKYYSISKEDKENYIISFIENSEETNDIISSDNLKEKLYQNLTTKIISVLLYNNSTLNFSIINSFKRKNKDNFFTPKYCERIWSVIPQNDYNIIKEGDIIKLGRLRLKFDKINFSNKNNKSENNNIINSRSSYTMININTNPMTTSNDYMPNINNNFSEELTKNNFMIETEKEKETIEKIYCRFCYQEESTISNPLICPCKCKGSMKYIHYSCLKKSIMQKIQVRKEKYFDLYFFKSYHCEICLETYPKYIKYKSYIYNLVEIDLSKFNDYIQTSIIYYTEKNHHVNNSNLEYENKKQLSYLGYLIFNIDEQMELKVGRNQNNEIVLKDISISRFHCVLKRENNLLKIKDKKSKFGTLLYIKNTKQIEPNISPLMLISGKHQFIFNLIYQEKLFGFFQNIFSKGCCSCNKKEKNEFVIEKNTIKKDMENNEMKEMKSNWNESLIEYALDSNDYYKRFKDNDSYNDYILNMESLIGVNDMAKDTYKEENYLLESIIFEK